MCIYVRSVYLYKCVCMCVCVLCICVLCVCRQSACLCTINKIVAMVTLTVWTFFSQVAAARREWYGCTGSRNPIRLCTGYDECGQRGGH